MIVFIKTLSGHVHPIEFTGREEVRQEELIPQLERPGLQLTLDESVSILRHEDVLTVVYTPIEFGLSDVQNVEQAFQSILGNHFVPFKEMMLRHQCLIAGGSILMALHGQTINDIDIYVHRKNAHALIIDLLGQMKMRSSVHGCPAYDDSFMKKNHIMGRFYCHCAQLGLCFDIMMIHDDIDLNHVVTNFDLTFCQVWWDGSRIDGTHVTDVRSRCGRLQNDYCSSYFQGNLFTQRRVAKYRKRGFTIHIDSDPIRDQMELVLGPKPPPVLIDKDHWKISAVLHSIAQYCDESLHHCQAFAILELRLLQHSLNWDHFVKMTGVPVVHAFVRYAWSKMSPFRSQRFQEMLPVSESDSDGDQEQIRHEFLVSQIEQLAPILRHLNDRLREVAGVHLNTEYYAMPRWRNLQVHP